MHSWTMFVLSVVQLLPFPSFNVNWKQDYNNSGCESSYILRFHWEKPLPLRTAQLFGGHAGHVLNCQSQLLRQLPGQVPCDGRGGFANEVPQWGAEEWDYQGNRGGFWQIVLPLYWYFKPKSEAELGWDNPNWVDSFIAICLFAQSYRLHLQSLVPNLLDSHLNYIAFANLHSLWVFAALFSSETTLQEAYPPPPADLNAGQQAKTRHQCGQLVNQRILLEISD